jgi:hypothetical protein
LEALLSHWGMMERVQVQSIPWRLFAASVVVLLAILARTNPITGSAGLNWETVKTLYWSIAILGLVCYAYGFRVLPRTFWRAYALIFTIDVTIRFATRIGWPLIAPLFGFPQASRHDLLIVLIGLGLIATTCVALLRYGGWLKRPADPQDLQSIFS